MLMYSLGEFSKLVSIIAVVLMTFTGISACAQSPNSGGNTPTQNQSPIKIGISIPSTGDFSDDGKALRQGYQIWADEANKQGGLLGRQVQLDVHNSDAKQVTVNYQKLITVDKVDLVAGPVSTTLTIAAMRVAKRYGYAFVEGVGEANAVFDTATSEKIDDLFAVSLPVKSYMNSFSDYILSLPQDIRPKTVAYMSRMGNSSLSILQITRKPSQNIPKRKPGDHATCQSGGRSGYTAFLERMLL